MVSIHPGLILYLAHSKTSVVRVGNTTEWIVDNKTEDVV